MKKIIFLYFISCFLIAAFVPLYSVFADLIELGPPSGATIYSNRINPGGVLQITGRNLPNNVKLTGNCENIITLVGQTGAYNTNLSVNIPNTIALGSYNVTVFGGNGSFDLSDKLNVVEKRGVSPTFPRSIVPSLLGTTNLGELIGNIFNFSIQILGLIIFVIIVISGFQWLTAGGNAGTIGKAKSRITQALLGAVILLSSFLILKTINPDLISGGRELEKINVPKNEIIITERGPCGEIVPLAAGQINACQSCFAYRPGITAGGQPIQCTGLYINTNLPVNNTATTCSYANVITAQKLEKFRQLNSNWILSEGFPPTVEHLDSCHANGTCVDIVPNPNIPSDPSKLTQQHLQQLANLCTAARQAGLSVTNEYYNLKNVWPSFHSCPPPSRFSSTTGGNFHLE